MYFTEICDCVNQRKINIYRDVAVLQEYEDVFTELPKKLPPKQGYEYTIKLVSRAEPIFKPIYQLSRAELDVLKSQLDDLLEHS